MAGAYSDSIFEGKSPQYAYALAILSGGIAFVLAHTGDSVAVWWLSFALLAALFAFVWPHAAWQWAGWLCLPVVMLLLFEVITNGNVQRLMLNAAVLAKVFLLTCAGVYVGSKLSIRKLANRRANVRREGKTTSSRSGGSQDALRKRRAAPAAIGKPSFSILRHEEHLRAIEPATPPQSPRDALIKAAQAGDLDKIGLLVAQGVDINAMSDDKCTPLMIAALGGDVQMVEALFGKGAAVNASGSEGWTALMIATIEGHAEVVRALIKQGADVNAANRSGWTALRYAVSMDEAEILRLLLEAGADASAADTLGQTALMQAAGEDSSAIIRVLLEAGADPRMRDKNGRTALRIARESGFAASIRLLKEAEAKAPATADVSGCIQCDDDSYLYLLKEELEEKLSRPAEASLHAHNDATDMLRTALQVVHEQIEYARKERLLAPSEIAHKLTLTPREASTLSGLPRQHLLAAIEGGQLQAHMVKHGWRITRAALDDYIRRLSVEKARP